MADIFTPILNIVSVLCSCTADNRCCYLMDLQQNKDSLNTTMEELKDVRDDVQRRVDEAENNLNESMKCNQEVKGWLQRVQAIEGEVVQVIQKANQEIQGRCFGDCCPKNCWSASKTGKRVIQTLATVNDLRIKGIFVDVAHKLPPPSVQNEPVNLSVGMDSTLKEVLESLAEDEVRIMGLYGKGGVGKTTLLKQINNEFLKSTTTITHGFDVVIYVVVSHTLNIDAIQMEIGKRLGLGSPERRSILNALAKKNFVLLLDDIWERVDLQSIGVPPVENSKSKVIFTTRSKDVCGLMDANKKFKVEHLPWNEAWTLFQEKVGNETINSDPDVPELAKVVAKECGGLPLALITIGRAMSSKKTPQEWRRAITTLRKSASEFPGMVDEVLCRLRLSYDSLPDETIKSCFFYCALYPEDHFIRISKLIDCWIGEGLILLDESDDIDDARNHGYDVIGILKGACLLETGRLEQIEVKMHHTIRDLALWIAHVSDGIKKDKMVIARASEQTTSERLWSNAERVYYLWGIDSFEIKIAPPKSPNLQTLLFEDAYHLRRLSIPNNLFEFMSLLRVLDLSYSHIETFPTSITELLELQYLNLSRTRIQVIPEELKKLVKLRYLDLSYMYHLKEIPSGAIGSLLELRVLDLQAWLSGAEWDIEEGYNLKYLNDLGIFINTQQNLNKLLKNQNLPKCVRRLGLDSIDGAELMNHYYYYYVEQQEQHLRSCFDELMNHYYYYNIQQQQHLASCFQNLSQIKVNYCDALKDLTWVGYVGNLKTLVVQSCEEIEEIVKVADDFGGSTGGDEIASTMNNVQDVFKGLETLRKMMNNVEDVFKRLEILNMSCLPKLKSICRNALAFPCLEHLVVDKCPQLKKLPFDSASNINNTLHWIHGEQKWWDELQWEDHDNVKSKFLPYFISFNDD